jgi:Rieske Fe-S protein
MDRRKFIKNSCVLCIGTAGLGIVATSCGTTSSIFKTTVENGLLTIPLSEFATKNFVLVRTPSVPYDIFTYKKSDTEFIALLMKCSHRDAAVQYTSGGLVCNEHGSKFSYEGKVVKEPATDPLTKFPITINQSSIIIQIKKA